jgi:2-desacetyl-2-hydroxyethyl bacteriochlorophyllide A dehydrogenase
MQALWLENRQIHYHPDHPVPKPEPGEALIRLRLAGVCSTDLEMLKGYYDFTGIPGHEFVGEIAQLPDKATRNNFKLGQRVVGEINIVCGHCRLCLAGYSSHCENRRTLGLNKHHGVFAEYLTLPVENLHAVPDSLADEAALFTEPLAAALEIQTQIHIQPNLKVLLIGAGRLGQLIAQTLALTGCELHVAVRRQRQRDLLEPRGIATLQSEEIQLAGYDLVIDATGSAKGLDLARQAVRPRGTIVLKSTFKANTQFNFSSLVVDEITLVGSRCGPFSPALKLLANKLVDPLPLIDDCFALNEGIRALEQAGKPGAMKIAISPPQR